MYDSDYLASMVFWVKRAYLAARKSMDHSLAEFHLTGSQFELLRHVLDQDGIELRSLQERLHISSATITRLVDGLVSRGLVRRVTAPEDARVKMLFVTDLGRELGKEVHRRAAEIEARMVAGFSPAEQALAKEFCARMVTNLGEGDSVESDAE
ncbi:MAG TPA: MarR family transcriptional regulator [Symbiobacteriaceae bacterium]|jgi:MarR family transcriptional regulator, transcriptional regulator for hemolysin|nr:MarR family transcriptional regulator [Symbiobacteriaceae bacterium]